MTKRLSVYTRILCPVCKVYSNRGNMKNHERSERHKNNVRINDIKSPTL